MVLTELTGENMYHAFLSGALEVIKQKAELNRINVFPVPDGDTGSNLAFTMYTIVENAKINDSVKQTMKSIADAAIDGARGNSGIIFAQYINGMYMGLKDNDDVDLSTFSKSVSKAVEYAYNSIANPVEGTMITVMKDWAGALGEYGQKSTDFVETMTLSLEVAMQSLRDTPLKLKVLRDAHVVDSGAKGFVHFLEGFLKFVITREVAIFNNKEVKVEYDEEMHMLENIDLTNRYCTEGLIKGKNLDTEFIKKELSKFGDSMVIAGNRDKMRVHIHTSKPEEIFKTLRSHGKIIQQKSDDMLRQYESAYDRKYDIAIITDSIADLPKEIMDKYQIHLLPLNLLIEDSNYLDKRTITSKAFYTIMDEIEVYPSSSQPTTKIVEHFISEVARSYDKIIAITVSSKMSGTYNTFKNAIDNLGMSEDRIALIDSKRNSGAEGLIVLEAAEYIAAGDAFETVVEKVNDVVLKSEIYVSVLDLKYMIKSGRIGRATGVIAGALNFKPVVSIDKKGDGSIIGKSFSVWSNTQKVYSLVREVANNTGISRYAVVHANSLDRAKEFVENIKEITGKEPEYIMEISSIVAMSAGIGSVAVALISE
ncbi:MAG: DegV family protein [Gudongella sp.]|nr:DegV family protein [Gudongella sp.]